ncbi:hypothetical protein KM043_010394 [Ampulex compressa]|nr:hypothetical protein KM043_010394 [Ampulex compressa]
MQLSPFRFTMVVSLLVCVVGVEAKSENRAILPAKIIRPARRLPLRNDIYTLGDKSNGNQGEEISSVEIRKLKEDGDKYENRGHYGTRHDRMAAYQGAFVDEKSSETRDLAQKLAKEALKSPKMQETMKKLEEISTPRSNNPASTKHPRVATRKSVEKSKIGEKNHEKLRSKNRRRKNRKRHKVRHERRRGQRSRWPQRNPAKKSPDARRETRIIVEKRPSLHTARIQHNREDFKQIVRNSAPTSRSNDKITIVKVDRKDEGDYVDATSTLNADAPLTKIPASTEKPYEKESMIERLMRTTTKDPTRRKSDDQGVEYSDYYNDNDVLRDIVANKIQVKFNEPRNPNDRVIRQTINASSSYNNDRLGIYTEPKQPILEDIDKYGANSRYDGSSFGSSGNLQDYPTVLHAPGLDDLGSGGAIQDNTFNNPVDYLPSDKSEDPAAAYPFDGNYQGNPPLGQLEKFDQATLPGAQMQNLQFSDPRKENCCGRSDSAGDFSGYSSDSSLPGKYGNLYEADNAQNIDSLEAKKFRVHEFDGDIDPSVENGKMFRADSEKQPYLNDPRQLQNFNKQSMNNIYSGRRGNEETQFARGVYNEYHNQPLAVSPPRIPNAMDQPLSKILESLGINVDGNSGSVDTLSHPDAGQNAYLPFSTMRNNAQSVDKLAKKRIPEEADKTFGEGWRKIDGANGLRRSNLQMFRAVETDDPVRNRAKEISYSPPEERERQRGDSSPSRTKVKKNNPPEISKEVVANDRRANITATVNETKEVASQILSRVIDELEELKLDRSKNHRREGLPCRLSGSWKTSQAGVRIDMKIVNRSISAILEDLLPRPEHRVLLDTSWNVTGHAPFKRGGPFSLFATNNHTNSVAAFVGACRVCQGIDTITGVWSVAREPSDCRDLQMATGVYNDIFRKTKLLSALQEKHGTKAENNSTSASLENATLANRSE